jgi:iron complex outermembrane receptor protein
MYVIPFRCHPLALLAALSCSAALAQTQTVVITGNPLGRDAVTQPTSVLAGEGLALRRSGTLGDTLDGLPGISSTGFGPNASRPVIRGLDGDRVRLLDNGGSSIDASNLSFDHASATDPLVAERIEVLRGPAALLYGGNATGGVVNSIDNRIPRLVAQGLSGRAEVRLGGAASERAGAAVLEGGASGWAWHADAFGRQADDLRVPRYTPIADGQALDATTRVRNSAARSEGGAIGGGWVSDNGYLGASVETARNRYGVTVEPDVFIRMQRDKLALAGEWRALPGLFTQLSAQASHTHYSHDEVEGSGEVGTRFSSTGDDLRLTARHAALGPLHGVVGLQAERMDFSALGAEAFVPGTRTRSTALFAVEEMQAGPLLFSSGVRSERVRVASDGDAPGAEEARFGAASARRFAPTSASLSARLGGGEGWQGSLTIGHTERAPAYYELYANGVHVATAAYERGDATLGAERSRHVEAGLGWVRGAHHLKANVYQTRFSRYLALDATGADIVIAGEDGAADTAVPEYAFRAVRARLQGLEVEGRTRLGGVAGSAFALELSGSLDAVRGDNLGTGEALPRLAPRRARVALEAVADGWRVGAGLRYSAAQTRVPATDSATPGWTLLDLWAAGALPYTTSSSWFARAGNVTDKLAYNAASVSTARGLSPLAGRSLTLGLRTRF